MEIVKMLRRVKVRFALLQAGVLRPLLIFPLVENTNGKQGLWRVDFMN